MLKMCGFHYKRKQIFPFVPIKQVFIGRNDSWNRFKHLNGFRQKYTDTVLCTYSSVADVDDTATSSK